MKWPWVRRKEYDFLQKRFEHTSDQAFRAWRTRTTFSKMTIDELQLVMEGIVDYKRMVDMLMPWGGAAPDPVWKRLMPIFDRYGLLD